MLSPHLSKAFWRIGVLFLIAGAWSLGVCTLDPLDVRVGMAWSEASQNINRVLHYRITSGIQAGSPLDETTGLPEYWAHLAFVEFYPHRQCVEFYLKAPVLEEDVPKLRILWGPGDGSRNPGDWTITQNWVIAGITVGPPVAGYGGKFFWSDLPKSHPRELNLTRYRPAAYLPWIIAGVASTILLFRRNRSAVAMDDASPARMGDSRPSGHDQRPPHPGSTT
jgi:hypothetical protein